MAEVIFPYIPKGGNWFTHVMFASLNTGGRGTNITASGLTGEFLLPSYYYEAKDYNAQITVIDTKTGMVETHTISTTFASWNSDTWGHVDNPIIFKDGTKVWTEKWKNKYNYTEDSDVIWVYRSSLNVAVFATAAMDVWTNTLF